MSAGLAVALVGRLYGITAELSDGEVLAARRHQRRIAVPR